MICVIAICQPSCLLGSAKSKRGGRMRVGQKTMAKLLAVILLNSSYSWTWYKWVTRQRRVLRLGRGMMAVRISCSSACWASIGRAKEGDKGERRERESTLYFLYFGITVQHTHTHTLTVDSQDLRSSLITNQWFR